MQERPAKFSYQNTESNGDMCTVTVDHTPHQIDACLIGGRDGMPIPSQMCELFLLYGDGEIPKEDLRNIQNSLNAQRCYANIINSINKRVN